MKNFIRILLFFQFQLLFHPLIGQTTNASSNLQPSIMIIPFVRSGEDLRTIIESDFTKRAAMAAVKNAFIKSGYINTTDCIQRIKSVMANSAFSSLNATDFQKEFQKNSEADINVIVDMEFDKSSTGNAVTFNLSAVETASGLDFASMSPDKCYSGKAYTDNIGILASKGIERCIDEFLQDIQTRYSNMINGGKPIHVEFQLSDNASVNFNSEIGSEAKLLSDHIDEWVSNNSANNNYKLNSLTDKMLEYTVNLPLKDKRGVNVNPINFRSQIKLFLKTLGISCDGVLRDANTILITIK